MRVESAFWNKKIHILTLDHASGFESRRNYSIVAWTAFEKFAHLLQLFSSGTLHFKIATVFFLLLGSASFVPNLCKLCWRQYGIGLQHTRCVFQICLKGKSSIVYLDTFSMLLDVVKDTLQKNHVLSAQSP